ncbi:ROK family transcriptional regulator [soil metagenome]
MAHKGAPGTGTNQEGVRRHNLGTLLGHLHRSGRISRAELTSRMGLNRSTIAGLVAELESLGVAEQVEPSGVRIGAGRPSVDVKPTDSGAYVLASEVRVDGLIVARVGLGGAVLARATAPIPASHDPEDVADAVVELLRIVTKDVPNRAALVGVGVSIPGIVGAVDGVVRLAPNLGWSDVPFAKILGARLGSIGVPVLGNDADLGALAEHNRGAAVDLGDLIYLSGDVGIGAGVIVGGRALEGAGGYAGEIGHLSHAPDGQLCRCGNRGCWETEIGAGSIAHAIGCPPEQIAALGEHLDSVTDPSEELKVVGQHLGRGLASVVNLLNPQAIILGGYLRALYPLVKADVDATLEARALHAPHEQVQILLPGLGGDSVLLGAAEVAFQPLLADPVAALARACRDVESELADRVSHG